MPFEIIYSGYDGLDLSYRTFLPDHILHILSAAKSEASKTHRSVAAHIGGVECVVSSSGAVGGYQFNVDTGPLGVTWLIKDAERSDPWGCRASIKSLPLALFTLEPNNFVCHSKSKKTDYRQIETTRAGDVISGIRIGKMPNLQLAVYDKRQDIIAKKKAYWWDIWSQHAGREIAHDQIVWRFELRAGRKAIDSYFNSTSWELISHCFGNLFRNIASRIRMVQPCSDTNRSRWPDDKIWTACRELIAAIPPHSPTALDPKAILERLEDERRIQLANQYFGLETSLAASVGYDADEFNEFLKRIA